MSNCKVSEARAVIREKIPPKWTGRLLLCALCFGWLGAWDQAQAVVFISTSDPSHNTTAPTGALSGSGWQWQAIWGPYTGTPIGPRHFITAQHIGGTVGDVVVLGGVSYTTTAFFDDPSSDLRICEISGTFPTWASLYRSSDAVGKPLVVFGRGLLRGAEVSVGGVLKGWQWGSSQGTLRWGQNTVTATYDQGGSIGFVLTASFDAPGGSNEAHLSTGDSAGGVFIQQGGVWKLAGINYSVDAYFNTTNSGDGFGATLFDVGGLYWGSTGNWQFVTDQTQNFPTKFYSTLISARLAWIDGIIAPPVEVPAVGAGGSALLVMLIALAGGAGILRSARREGGALESRPPERSAGN